MRTCLFWVSLLFIQASFADEAVRPPLRIGVLPFGSLNWELSVLQSEGLDKKNNLSPLETVPVANAEAGKIALLGHRVDVIVSDWIWVASQREQGRDVKFYPYSTTLGALMVPANSPIHNVSDLKNRKLGVAGGALDKNWLLLKAMVQKSTGQDLEQMTTPVYGAPPLLNQQLQQGRLDAVLNYWNFAAKLEAKGFRRVLDGQGILQGLGVTANIPSLGYVFNGTWADTDAGSMKRFFDALGSAKNLICEDDKVWKNVAKLTEETEPKTQDSLRVHYCAGRVKSFGEAERRAVGDVYALLHRVGGTQVTGRSPTLPEGVFWSDWTNQP